MGSWVNTNAQVLDFEFHLEVPVHEDNYYVFNLYQGWLDYYEDLGVNATYPEYDYDLYMAGMAEMRKFEVQFQCLKVEDPIPEPTVEITTLEESSINSFYENGLDQENLIILFLKYFNVFDR